MNKNEDFIKYYLDDFGRLVFKHKTNKNLFLHRAFYWKDRLILLDEFLRRKVLEDTLFSTYDLENWIPLTKAEDSKVKSNYTEIYEKINKKH